MQNGTIYDFSDFRLIPADDLLLRDGEPVPLPPKAYATLVLLVARHGHLVKKSELIEKVWENAFIEEAAVSRCVWTIRNALGEDSKNQQFIKTFPKRGYKFVAPVSIVDDGPAVIPTTNGNGSIAAVSTQVPSLPTMDITVTESSSGKWSGKRHSLTALALVGIALLATYAIFFRQSTVANGVSFSIAVLPPQPVNAEVDDPRYELALADALILKLSSSGNLVVRSLQAVQDYSDRKKDALQAGREQNVEYVLTSNYQTAEGKIRVISQLLHVGSGSVEDIFKLERPLTDFFSTQDSVADELGNNVLARFAVKPTTPMKKRGTSNEQAYRNYLQAMYLYDKRSRANAEKARELFQQAVELDPNYAAAWAGKAHAIGSFVGKDVDTHAQYRQSMEAVNMALALDADLADAHSALCVNKFLYEWDFDGAELACKRSLELDPNSSLAHNAYSTLLVGRGRFDEAINEAKTAIDLDPASFFNQRNYGSCLYYARRYPDAMSQLKRVVEMDPNYGNLSWWLESAAVAQGNFDEAFSWFIKGERLRKADEAALRDLTSVYETSGWQGVMRERAKQSDTDNRSYSRSACTNLAAGDPDKAFEFLEIALERRETWIFFIQVEPCFDSVRSDPRYEKLIGRISAN